MDIVRNKVSVIVSFDSTGNILPLYLRVNGETVKVLSSSPYHTDSFGLNLLCFRIKYQQQEQLREALLYYHRKEGLWYI